MNQDGDHSSVMRTSEALKGYLEEDLRSFLDFVQEDMKEGKKKNKSSQAFICRLVDSPLVVRL